MLCLQDSLKYLFQQTYPITRTGNIKVVPGEADPLLIKCLLSGPLWNRVKNIKPLNTTCLSTFKMHMTSNYLLYCMRC